MRAFLHGSTKRKILILRIEFQTKFMLKSLTLLNHMYLKGLLGIFKRLSLHQ